MAEYLARFCALTLRVSVLLARAPSDLAFPFCIGLTRYVRRAAQNVWLGLSLLMAGRVSHLIKRAGLRGTSSRVAVIIEKSRALCYPVPSLLVSCHRQARVRNNTKYAIHFFSSVAYFYYITRSVRVNSASTFQSFLPSPARWRVRQNHNRCLARCSGATRISIRHVRPCVPNSNSSRRVRAGL